MAVERQQEPRISDDTDDDSDLLSRAQSVLALLSSASTEEQVTKAEGMLGDIALRAKNSHASGAILSYISIARIKLGEIRSEHYLAHIEASRFVMDPNAQNLYDSMASRGILTKEQIKEIESIDPKKVYTIPVLDENGKPIEGKTEQITGAELRASMIRVGASRNYNLLSLLERKQFEASLDSTGLSRPEALRRDIFRVGGYHYSRSATPAELAAVRTEVINELSMIDQVLGTATPAAPAPPRVIPIAPVLAPIIPAGPTPPLSRAVQPYIEDARERELNAMVDSVINTAADNDARRLVAPDSVTPPIVIPPAITVPVAAPLQQSDTALIEGFRARSEQPPAPPAVVPQAPLPTPAVIAAVVGPPPAPVSTAPVPASSISIPDDDNDLASLINSTINSAAAPRAAVAPPAVTAVASAPVTPPSIDALSIASLVSRGALDGLGILDVSTTPGSSVDVYASSTPVRPPARRDNGASIS